jgi:hypothetical protein
MGDEGQPDDLTHVLAPTSAPVLRESNTFEIDAPNTRPIVVQTINWVVNV